MTSRTSRKFSLTSSCIGTSTSTTPASANGSAAVDGETGQIAYTPAENFNGEDSFTYEVTDGELTEAATVTVTVTPVNDLPEAVADETATNEDVAVLVDVLANDTDLDGDTLRVASVSQPAGGTAAIDADTGQVRYTPDADFNGEDSFSYTATDDAGGTATTTVAVSVAAVNDAPVAMDDTAETAEDSPVLIDAAANDTDIDGDTLAVSQVLGQPANGTAAIDGDSGQILYTPNENFNGTDSIAYEVSDGAGGTASATVDVRVAPVNDSPVAEDDTFTVVEDSDRVRLDLLANDSDVDGGRLRIIEVEAPENGEVIIGRRADAIAYRPDADFDGSESFVYTMADADGATSQATVTVTVDPVNDAPVAANDSFSVAVDSSGNSLDILNNDSDIDSPINRGSVQISSQPSNGTAVFAGDGAIDYTPTPGFTGTDRFSYSVADAQGLGSNTARVTVSVEAEQAPEETEALAVSEVLGGDNITVGNGDDLQSTPAATSSEAPSVNLSVLIAESGETAG